MPGPTSPAAAVAVTRWVVLDFTDVVSGACPDLDQKIRNVTDDDLEYLLPPKNSVSDNCRDNVAVRMTADRVLKANAQYQPLDFKLVRPIHIGTTKPAILWSPSGNYGLQFVLSVAIKNQQSAGNRITSAELTTTDVSADDRAEARVLNPDGTVLGTYKIRFSMLVARSGPLL